MKVRVVTDSAADFPLDFIEKFDIGIIPHSVHFENQAWKIGIGISVKEYYERLRNMNEMPKNATPTPQDFDNVFKESLEAKNYDHILYIAISEKLSSTINPARIAAKKYKDKITIFNTESASGVQGLFVLRAVKLLSENKTIKEILEIFTILRNEYILDVGFFTLENVYKSGRLKSKSVLYLTKLIGIKPIAIMERPGELVSVVPGFFFKSHMERRLANIIISRAKKEKSYDMIISNVENIKGAKSVTNLIKKKLKIKEDYITDCSPIIGTNTGEGTIIISLIPSSD
ncbi:MAG: DegV family protein [Candidatus Heimdallarchaeota archaeon]|nr:DegV family protein [Candidatus Heimdallarchaeota archaeon]MCK4876882.1 DegV family protein [Candidatus Heimdallarchaeota archaeon]